MQRCSVVASYDARLSVTICGQRTLRYSQPAGTADRPAHVRAASGLTRALGRWYVVQDDTAFVGVVDGASIHAIEWPLPSEAGPRRQFSTALGNKAAKPDFEACFTSGQAAAARVWAVGSGSTDRRRAIAQLDPHTGTTRCFDATGLHLQIVDELGHLPNLEGACVRADALWLFHRGNTGEHDRGCCAFAWSWPAVEAWLLAGGPVPAMTAVTLFDVGEIQGVRWGITDVAVGPAGRVAVLCAAESSANAVDDGAVVGARIGVLDVDDAGAWTQLRVVDVPAHVAGAGNYKPEGLFIDETSPGHAFLVADPDDTEVPAVLCEVVLAGPWWPVR